MNSKRTDNPKWEHQAARRAKDTYKVNAAYKAATLALNVRSASTDH